MSFNVPKDVLSSSSPPGRAVFSSETNEVQIATPGGALTPADQGAAIDALAARLRSAGVAEAPGVDRLAEMVPIGSLPTSTDGFPAVGIAQATLVPLGFDPQGSMMIAGMPGSGRTTALRTIVQALRRWDPELPLYYFGPKRSIVRNESAWTRVATDMDAMKELAAELTEKAAESADDRPGLVLVIESLGELVSSPCEKAVLEVIKLARRNGHLVIGEQDTSGWSSSWPLIAEVRAERRGIVMQPDPTDGDIIFKTSLPRVKRSEYPPGRGVYVVSGKTSIIQLAFPEDANG